jgi:hypothetical protein
LGLLGTDEVDNPDDRSNHTPVRTLILKRFLNLGIILVILAAIPSQNALLLPLPLVSNSVPASVAYFVLGIALVSLTRYVNLETTWLQAKLKVPVQIPRRWFAYSALILFVLVGLIAWLPTDYGMGFFATLRAIFQLLYQAILTLYSLFILGLALLAHLLGKKAPEPQANQPPTFTPPPNTLPGASANTINWELVKSVFVWGTLIILAVIALRQYISFNRELSEELRRFRWLNWLISAWGRFKAAFKKTNQSVAILIQNGLKRLRRAGPDSLQPGGDWDFINPRRLNSRQKVIFYYLALVRRAKEAGLPRQEGQTPYEYAQALSTSLKEQKDGLDGMTEAFIEARYTRHDIPAREARRAKSIWESIRNVLRNIRKSSREGKAQDDQAASQ